MSARAPSAIGALAGREGSSLSTAAFFIAASAMVGANYGANLSLFPSITKDFYGAKESHSHKTPFELDADEPPLLLGKGLGPNPVEHFLNALAACITTALVYHAAAKGIEVRGV